MHTTSSAIGPIGAGREQASTAVQVHCQDYVCTKKSDYTVHRFSDRYFCSIEELKEALHNKFPAELPQSTNIQVGYIEPGHGLRGKQQWLCEDGDLNDMYSHYAGKKEITIWCFCKVNSQSHKRGKSLSPKPVKLPRVSPYDSQLAKTSQVQEIVKELEDRHKGKFSAEQLHTWANLIQMKKHAS